MTRFPVTALRSVELGTPDLGQSLAFYRDVWGLEAVESGPEAAYLRASGADHHVLVLRASARSELRSVTFRVETIADLEAIARRATQHGAAVLSGPAAADDPGGGTLLTLRKPMGGVVRLVYGDARHADACAMANRPLRLAHVNLNSVDADRQTIFFETVLGFRLTDRTKSMAFVRCNSDHHAVVIAEAPVNGLNHIAFLLPDLESVMRACGRMIDHGYPIAWGVGRHGPGDNVFAYFLDPLGVVIEYTAEVLQVDDAYQFRGPNEWQWPPGRTDHWGIAPPKADHVKAAQLAIPYATG